MIKLSTFYHDIVKCNLKNRMITPIRKNIFECGQGLMVIFKSRAESALSNGPPYQKT